jgi:hypothetical protein
MHRELVTLTVLVAGFPQGLIVPKPLPGETLGHLVIRNHPHEWKNCIDRISPEHPISSGLLHQLADGHLDDVTDPRLQEELQRFFNRRLPTHGRTMQGVSETNHYLSSSDSIGTLRIGDVLWPRQADPTGNRDPERKAQDLGVRVLTRASGKSIELDFREYLAEVTGDFLWIVAGGTRLSSVTTALKLGRVIRTFASDPQTALYSDNGYSLIYRTSALSAVIRGASGSANAGLIARMLQQAGYRYRTDSDPAARLCELEKEYGGQD